MKYIEPAPGSKLPCIELTRRNLLILLEKLDDNASHKTIVDADWTIMVTAVEDDAHYGDRTPGVMYMPTAGEYK